MEVVVMGSFKIIETKTGHVFHLAAGNGETIGTSQVYSSKAACLKGTESVRANAVAAKVEDQTANESVTNPKFEIYADKAGQFRFRLRASNGEEILSSEGYKSKESCKHGIESVRKNAPDAKTVEE